MFETKHAYCSLSWFCIPPNTVTSNFIFHNSRSGAFGRVLSYDGQMLSRSEDVGHQFDPFFIQTPFCLMPCAFGKVGCNIGSSKHHEIDPGSHCPGSFVVNLRFARRGVWRGSVLRAHSFSVHVRRARTRETSKALGTPHLWKNS